MSNKEELYLSETLVILPSSKIYLRLKLMNYRLHDVLLKPQRKFTINLFRPDSIPYG